jgi:hypothetical protein
LVAQIDPRGDGFLGEVLQQRATRVLHHHGKLVGHDLIVSTDSLDANGIYL